MYCKQCGEQNRNDRKFCVNCGARLTDYTKPKDNLLMPDDVIKTNKKKKRLKKLNLFCNIMAVVFIVFAVGLVVTSYIVSKKFDITIIYSILAIVCLGLSIVMLLIGAIARVKYKNMD